MNKKLTQNDLSSLIEVIIHCFEVLITTFYKKSLHNSLISKHRDLTEFITQRPWAVVSEQSEGTTKGLRVVNSIDHCVLKSNNF